ncbi:MAG: hypothetical protein IJT83_14565 [Victivallales bacterium]|nr:hypothetical protein [Victivallales bacterium]
MKTLFYVLSFLVAVGCVQAQQSAGSAELLRNPVVWESGETLRLTSEAEPKTVALSLPVLRLAPGTIPVLTFDCRILNETALGWNPYLGIQVNGKHLTPRTPEGHNRLLCRQENVITTHPREKELRFWNTRGQSIRLLNFFAPESATELDAYVQTDRQEGYRYCLNIADVASVFTIGADNRIENDAPNTIAFTFFLTTGAANGNIYTIVIKDIRIVQISKGDLGKYGGIQVQKLQPGVAAASLESSNIRLQVDKSGGVELQHKGEIFYLESNFSYPDTPVMKWNRLGIQDTEGQPCWKPIVLNEKDAIVVSAHGASYDVMRTIRLHGHRIEFTDAIRNTSDKELGIALHTAFSTNDCTLMLNRLAGAEGISRAVWHSASNPTVFLAGKTASIGAVTEDTLFRTHLVLTANGNILKMGTEGIGIAPGETITHKWALYPTAGTDYFEFLNQLRRDWNVNKRIPGPFWNWFKIPPQLKPEIVFVGSWLDYTNNAATKGLSHETYLQQIASERKLLAQGHSDAKLFGLLETNLIAFDCSKVPWGDELVQRTGARTDPGIQYGIFMSKETTAKLDAMTPYRDAIIRDSEGRALYDNYYPKKPYVNLMVQLEEGNSRQRLFAEQRRFLLEEAKLQGVYIDQFQPAPIGGTSENRYDGHTVVLNADGTIKSRLYSYAMTGAVARANVVRDIVNHGGMVLINGQAMTMEEQNDGRIAFQEMENDRADVLEFLDSKPPSSLFHTMCHLGSPLLLGLRAHRYAKAGEVPDRRAAVIFKGIIWGLRSGLLTYYYNDYAGNMPLEGPDAGSYEPGNHLFPFTPIELHEGWVVGKERIITCTPRTITFAPQKQPPQILLFDRRGNPKEHHFTIEKKDALWSVDINLDAWNELAVIEFQE